MQLAPASPLLHRATINTSGSDSCSHSNSGRGSCCEMDDNSVVRNTNTVMTKVVMLLRGLVQKYERLGM